MRVTRRELLRGAGSFVSAALLGSHSTSAQRRRSRSRPTRTVTVAEAGPLSGAKLFEDVIAYYNLGEHRTATEVDLKTSQWLVDLLRKAGLKATFQSFGLRQFLVHETNLTFGDRSIRAFPLWYPRGTGSSPINAALSVFDKNGRPQTARGKI